MRNNRRLTRASAAAIALLLFSTIAAAQPTRDASLSRIQIDNFGEVNAGYYRGAQPHGHDYADLAALGVKTVIDLTSDDADASEPALAAAAGLKYVHIPMTTHEPPTTAQLTQFLSIVQDAITQPVYVHCVGGRHRTGVMTAVYRMTNEGWTAQRAFAEMKNYKFGADFLHPEFKQFVYAYHPVQPAPTKVLVATNTTP